MRFSSELEEHHDRHERIVASLDDSPAPPSVVSPPERRRLFCTACRAACTMSVTDDELVSLECASCLKTGDMRVWTRDVVRSRRPRDVRAKTINTERMSKLKLAIGRELYPTPDDVPARPKTRAGCVDVPRPCPYVSCKHNLYLDVSPKTGSIKLNFPDIDPDQMTTPSCSLDVADKRGETLEEVGRNMNMTRERVRQIEVKSLTKMRPHVTGDLRDAFCTPVGFHDGGECE